MIYVLYGSQSGNCESISRILYDILNDGSEPIIYGTLNSIVHDLENITGKLYIICSTFGNGDAPENAAAFWRCIKNRKIKNDLFQNVNYMVLGLGDSNYSHFCYMGEKIDKRIKELGGQRMNSLVCFDEVDGLEEQTEKWLEQFRT